MLEIHLKIKTLFIAYESVENIIRKTEQRHKSHAAAAVILGGKRLI